MLGEITIVRHLSLEGRGLQSRNESIGNDRNIAARSWKDRGTSMPLDLGDHQGDGGGGRLPCDEFVSNLACPDTCDLEAFTSVAGWLSSITLFNCVGMMRQARDCRQRKFTFFLCFRQASQPCPTGPAGMLGRVG